MRRLEADLKRLEKSCRSGRVRYVTLAERRLGRLLERYQRAGRFFTTAVAQKKNGVRFAWARREEKLAWARRSKGCYVLRSNVQDWTPEDLWTAYIQLTDAEEAFRIEKDDLRPRPVWHQKQHRVQAHILVCFLDYVLWKCFGQMCRQAGLGDEHRKIIEEIKKLQLNDVVLPTRRAVDIRLRCSEDSEIDVLNINDLAFRKAQNCRTWASKDHIVVIEAVDLISGEEIELSRAIGRGGAP